MDSRRRLTTRRSRAASLAFAWRCPRGADDPARQLSDDPATMLLDCPRGGLSDALGRVVVMGDDRPLLPDSKVDPAAAPGLAGDVRGLRDDGGDRHEQPSAMLGEGDRQDPRPALGANRASRRVFSLDRSRPITATTRWRRSALRRIAPVVKRTRPRSRRRALEPKEPDASSPRRPCLACDQLWSAATRSAIPQA